MNEVLGVTTAGMTQLHTKCNLRDAVLEQHGVTEFTTYQWGAKVIDYILVTHNVMRCTQATGYEPFCLHILSDHRDIFLDISTAQCFGSNIQPLQPIQLRDTSIKREHQVAPYFQEKQKHLQEHNWFAKIKDLQNATRRDKEDNALAEDLYKRLISASNYSASKLYRYRKW